VAAQRYPTGYGNRLVSLDALHGEHATRMHPEYARRLFACIEDAAGLVGIGNGWRSRETQAANHQRSPRTFAPPGLSFHESHRFASGIDAFAAVDTVGVDGRHDEAWDWMRDNAGRFGLRTFWNVNGEPWHTQCNDLPNGVSAWTGAGCPDPPASGVVATLAAAPVADYGLHPLNPDKPVVQLGWHGDMVDYVQTVILREAGGGITVDGDFGPKTDGRVRDLQSFMKLPVTGVVDWSGTWQIIDHLAGNRLPAPAAAAPDPSADVTPVDRGTYWVQRGDSPWLVAQRVFGDGARWKTLEPTDPPAPGFGAADHQIVIHGMAGVTTVVRPGDRVWSLVGRLCPDTNPADLVARFQDLNGGAHRILHPGDVVFMDRPR
jgi:peptidoglycan hydrolase-like protein with peptidoglycan-binding domain